jgi:hypothetical protein
MEREGLKNLPMTLTPKSSGPIFQKIHTKKFSARATQPVTREMGFRVTYSPKIIPPPEGLPILGPVLMRKIGSLRRSGFG